MKTTNNFLFTIGQPITTINEAKAFIRYLVKKGKLWHFDDDPKECGFTKHQAKLLEKRRDEIFNFTFQDWGQYKCPFGYAIHYHNKNGDL